MMQLLTKNKPDLENILFPVSANGKLISLSYLLFDTCLELSIDNYDIIVLSINSLAVTELYLKLRALQMKNTNSKVSIIHYPLNLII